MVAGGAEHRDADLEAGILHILAKGGTRERVFLNPALVRMLGCFLSLGLARDKQESARTGNGG